MALRQLLNHTCGTAAEVFRVFRDFLTGPDGPGWTIVDASYASGDPADTASGDWCVIRSDGENGVRPLYLRLVHKTTRHRVDCFLDWDGASHTGTGVDAPYNNLWCQDPPDVVNIHADKDEIHYIVRSAWDSDDRHYWAVFGRLNSGAAGAAACVAGAVSWNLTNGRLVYALDYDEATAGGSLNPKPLKLEAELGTVSAAAGAAPTTAAMRLLNADGLATGHTLALARHHNAMPAEPGEPWTDAEGVVWRRYYLSAIDCAIVLRDADDSGGGEDGEIRQALGLHWDAASRYRQALELHWEISHYRQALELHWEISQGRRARQRLLLWWDEASQPRQAMPLYWEATYPARQALALHWDAAFSARQSMSLSWAESVAIRQSLPLDWGSTTSTRQSLGIMWGEAAPVRQDLPLQWGVKAATRQSLSLNWGVKEQTRRALVLRWGDVGTPVQPSTDSWATLAGQPVYPISIQVTEDADQIAITATLDFVQSLPVALTRPGTALVLVTLGIRYELLVESYSRSRRFGSHVWTLTASSPAAQLQSRFSVPVNGELFGLASRIVGQMAGGIPLDWRMVDWEIPSGRLVSEGASPLDVLRDVTSAAGGRVISDRDGTLVAMPWPPFRPEAWPEKAELTVDSLSSMISLIDDDAAVEPYNLVIVSDGEDGTELRIEVDEEANRGSVVEVLVYRIPWQMDFTLRHCGKSIVLLEDIGVEERIIEEEYIEIVDGKGRSKHPIYAVSNVRWNAVNLGDIIPSEDGTIMADSPKESILYLTYRTKARRYRITPGESAPEPLMLVAESDN